MELFCYCRNGFGVEDSRVISPDQLLSVARNVECQFTARRESTVFARFAKVDGQRKSGVFLPLQRWMPRHHVQCVSGMVPDLSQLSSNRRAQILPTLFRANVKIHR